MNREINKKLFWRILNKKTKNKTHHYHVFAVLSILFEEMIKDLKSNKRIKIFNFASILLENKKPKKYFDVRHQKIMISKGSKRLKISLIKKFRDKLINYLDVDASIGND
jgi:hypothetical protein